MWHCRGCGISSVKCEGNLKWPQRCILESLGNLKMSGTSRWFTETRHDRFIQRKRRFVPRRHCTVFCKSQRKTGRMPKGEFKLKCPNCDKEWIAEIFWGYPGDMESLKGQLDKKEIVLGGCLVTGFDPKWECNNCHHRWGEREDLDV